MKYTLTEFIKEYGHILHRTNVSDVIVDDNYVKVYLNDTLVSEFPMVLYNGKYVMHGVYKAYFLDGSKMYKVYYKNGEYHREDGPAYYQWTYEKTKDRESYYKDGKLHREDGPTSTYWHNNGKLRFIGYNANGKRHRIDGPAAQYYYTDGKLVEESYYVDGELHREDGPALYRDDDGVVTLEWYYHGNKYEPTLTKRA
tara:strand:- start:44 stop:637 length:594 start_codon:yes stop_codon:yes gene_type:complete